MVFFKKTEIYTQTCLKMRDFSAVRRFVKIQPLTFIKRRRNVLAVCPGAFITVHGGDIGRGNDVSLCICEQGPSVVNIKMKNTLIKSFSHVMSSGTCIPVKEDCKWISIHLGL